MAKVYQVLLSESISCRVGLTEMYMEGDDPRKAVKNAFEKLGYKVHLVRLHTYSYDSKPADIVTKLQTKTGTIYHSYYRLRVMIKLPK